MIEQRTNQLILGDNLEVLKRLPSESVDLVYIDPPFFSNRNYEVIWGDEGEMRSFTDRWAGGMEHYISWLYERVQEMYRLLKPTGSFYLHCDWHADAYIRVQILDKIFGNSNFRNHIVWQRTNAKSNSTKKFGVLIDTLYFYSKSDTYIFNQTFEEFSSAQMSRYKNQDEKGLFRCDDLTTPGLARQFEWRGVHPGKNRSWSKDLLGLEDLISQNLIVFQKDGRPRKDGLKKYLIDTNGAKVGNLWTDIQLGNTSKERIGYPTQKPEALLERIIKASSNPGALILDAFCGGGTTLAVANKLGRNWIGIDQSVHAIKVSEQRIANQRDLLADPFSTTLHTYDYDTLRNSDAFAFERWIVEQFGGEPNIKQRGDFGIDGHKNYTPIQVKRSDKIGRNVIDNFKSGIARYRQSTAIQAKDDVDGYLIAFSFGKGAIEEVARLKNTENIAIVLLKVEDIVPIAKKPSLHLVMTKTHRTEKEQWEITFKATSETPTELFQWDFNFTEDKFIADSKGMWDKTGEIKHTFSAGTYTIACKVIDSEGIEAVHHIRITVNGKVETL